MKNTTIAPKVELLGVVLALALGACSDPASKGPLNFNRDIAPIIHNSCTICHRPGEAAPFSLITYRDVAKRSKQIAQVTKSRFMPPWKPEPGVNHFVGDRSLKTEQIDLIARWVEEGKLEGEPEALHPAPRFDNGWQLGEPDLVVSMEQTYTLQAEGQDVYRNFIIPARTADTRYVRAVEFRPDNRVIVHHSLLFVDRANAARAAERNDPFPGYDGMGAGELRIPDGQFIGWVPGKLVLPGSDDVAWSIDKKTDLVVQVHMRPTGKPEPLRMSLGLYFNDDAPTKHPVSVRMASREIDIPAGEANYLVETEYRLPVNGDFIGVYPHTHYLGKDISLQAVKPDGTRLWLLHIPSWDYNWQDEYRYVEPIHLPAGTRIEFKYTFDNSADNPLNPNHPPIRVAHGPQSQDEMAEVVFQILTSPGDRPVLMQHYKNHELSYELNYRKRLAAANPQVPTEFNTAAGYAMQLGLGDEAIELYKEVVAMTTGNITPVYNLGRAYFVAGKLQLALDQFNQVLAKQQGNTGALIDRARVQRVMGHPGRAQKDLRRALVFEPQNSRAQIVLAEILLEKGHTEAALAHLASILSHSPDHTRALWNTGLVQLGRGQKQAARRFCERAVVSRPEDSDAHLALGRVRQVLGLNQAARSSFRTAQLLAPSNSSIQELLDALP